MFYEKGTTVDKLHQLMSWTWEVDDECSLGDAVTVERCVRDVMKRPRYFQRYYEGSAWGYDCRWTEQIGLASGLSKRHPYRGNHGQ